MRNQELIACPIPEKRNERKEGRQAAEPEPGTSRSQKITILFLRKEKKEKEGTSPGTLAGTRRKEEIMMEHIAAIPRRQAPRPFLGPDGTRTDGTESQKTTRNQEMEMEQDAKRVGRPGKDEWTGCQKSRETSPGTLVGTRKWWWNRMPKE